MRASPALVAWIAFATLVAGACSDGGSDVSAMTVTIDRVIDGDTVDVMIGDDTERVRLIGINTPEIAHESSGTRPATEGDCFGDEATAYTTSLVPPGTPVRLERDVVARDDYGRLLAYLYRASDGVFVNYEIVRHGFARPLTIAPNDTFVGLIVEAARQAEAAGVGLWTACGEA